MSVDFSSPKRFGLSRLHSFADMPMAAKFIVTMAIPATMGTVCLIYVVGAFSSISDMILNADLQQVQDRSYMTGQIEIFARNASIFIGLAITVGLSVATFVGHFKVGAPLNALRQTMQIMATGEFDLTIDFQDRQDELGDMARTLLVFKKSGLEVERLRRREKAKQDEEKATRESLIKVSRATSTRSCTT